MSYQSSTQFPMDDIMSATPEHDASSLNNPFNTPQHYNTQPTPNITADTSMEVTSPLTTDVITAVPMNVSSSVASLSKEPEGFALPSKPKPLTSTYLDRQISPIGVPGMCFQNFDEAMAAMALNQWQAPGGDLSLPKNNQDLRNFAKQLTDAFEDCSAAIDAAESGYRRRVTPGRKEYYGKWAIESCAWHILKMAMDLHTKGFNVPIYDKSLMDNIGETQMWALQERIDWICLVLKTSKSTVASVMKHEKMWTIIGAPHKLYYSAIVNYESNAKRNQWVKEGRAQDPTYRPTRGKGLDQAAEIRQPGEPIPIPARPGAFPHLLAPAAPPQTPFLSNRMRSTQPQAGSNTTTSTTPSTPLTARPNPVTTHHYTSDNIPTNHSFRMNFELLFTDSIENTSTIQMANRNPEDIGAAMTLASLSQHHERST